MKSREIGRPEGEPHTETELVRIHVKQGLVEDLQQKWCKSVMSKLIGQLCKWDSLT